MTSQTKSFRQTNAGLFGRLMIAVIMGSVETVAQSPSSPVVGQLIEPVLLRGVEDVHLEGDYAYLPCREGQRLTICSIKDPAAPKIVSSFTHETLRHAAGFAINGDIVYVVSQSNQCLLAIDASDKANLKLIGSVVVGQSGAGILYKVAYRDGHYYVANQSEKKLYVVDVGIPEQPVAVGAVAVTTENDGPFSVLLRDDYALVGTIFGSHNRLAVVDIRKSAKPRLVTQVVGPAIGQLSGEVVDDLYISVNWDTNALLIIDVANTAAPKLLSKLVDERLGKPNRCVVAGNRAYLPMTSGHGVAVVDISDPMQPQFVTAYQDEVMKKTYGAAVRGDLLFIGSREGNSLVVLDRGRLEAVE